MQQLYLSHMIVDGGKRIDTVLTRPEVDKEGHATGYHGKGVSQVWLRPGKELIDKVLEDIGQIDSYRDVAVMAKPYSPAIQEYQIPDLDLRTGLHHRTYFLNLEELSPPEGAVISMDGIIDLTNLMNPDGTLSWDAPEGKWKIIRLGHGSNFKMTRPSPTHAIGLESDRLSKKGIDIHFGNQLYYKTMKVAASAAHTTNKTLVGTEAFTASRGWGDHPYPSLAIYWHTPADNT